MSAVIHTHTVQIVSDSFNDFFKNTKHALWLQHNLKCKILHLQSSASFPCNSVYFKLIWEFEECSFFLCIASKSNPHCSSGCRVQPLIELHLLSTYSVLEKESSPCVWCVTCSDGASGRIVRKRLKRVRWAINERKRNLYSKDLYISYCMRDRISRQQL